MSLRALPLLFINLGGEMIYILDQRLTAQKIPKHKGEKVINDIVGTMLNARFAEELFRPQEIYAKLVVKQAFEKLAHASIMRLNASSMDKLYDLITMALKYQVIMCPRPSDLLLITLNHLDAMKAMVTNDHVANQVDNFYRLLMKNYGMMNESEFQFIRFTLLNFFQDIHIRVSMFLRDKYQNPNGQFVVPLSGPVPTGTEIPGSIRLFRSNGELLGMKHFHNGGKYQPAVKPGSLESGEDRVTKLGTNMYSATKPDENMVQSPSETESPTKTLDTASMAKEELNFLAQLIGGSKVAPQKAEFRLNLFDYSCIDEPSTERKDVKENVIKLSASKNNEELSRIMGEMVIGSESKGRNDDDEPNDDLLELMDSACK